MGRIHAPLALIFLLICSASAFAVEERAKPDERKDLYVYAESTTPDPLKSKSRLAYSKIENNKNQIALTFDDGPNQYTESILTVLRKHQVNATFFQIGEKLKQAPDLTRRILDKGHELGNHSMTHPRLPELETKAAIQKEIKDVQVLATNMVGTTPKVFRAPYIHFDERVWDVLDELDLPAFNADVWADYKGDGDLADPAIASAHAKASAARVKSGSIILMHEREMTLCYLDEVIAQLKADGFDFVTVSELMKHTPPT